MENNAVLVFKLLLIRSGQVLKNHREGRVADFSSIAERVKHNEILLPEKAHPRYADREFLWNEVDRVEDLSTRPTTAQTAREIEFALPKELSDSQRLKLARGFIQRNFVDHGMIADMAKDIDFHNMMIRVLRGKGHIARTVRLDIYSAHYKAIN